MPRPVRLVFGVHSHQPVGNLGEVFHRALSTAYEPFLAALSRHPRVKAVLHYSGCLCEWLEEYAPGHLDAIALLARRGQVEILSGGFYEPILSLLPVTDRVGQIRMQSRYIRRRFGVEPKGMWLAERIWEPTLPGTLREAGIEYTLLDDYHFLASLDESPVGASYVTEDLGHPVRLFPISEALRYLIPFQEPEKTIEWLRALGESWPADRPDPVAVIVDDGEKFGLWPRTHDWVYGSEGKSGWLERFLTALEANSGWLVTTTFQEAAALPSGGTVYLPPASYFEMGEWALPPGRGRQYAKAVEAARGRGSWEADRPFLRGGYFRNYLARYPESALSLRRARLLSAAMDERAEDRQAALAGEPGEARQELWRATCNCGYWHGIFGGLYLPFIRRAVGEHLCRAERLSAPAPVRSETGEPGAWAAPRASGAGGPDDAVVATPALTALVEPGQGGAIRVLDVCLADFPLGQTLTRRVEIYHDAVLAGPAEKATAPADPEVQASIHDLAAEATEEMRALVVADDRTRASAVDRFLPAGTRAAGLAMARAADLGDFFDGPYTIERLIPEGAGRAGVTMRRRGSVAGRPLTIVKTISARGAGDGLDLLYRLEEGAPAGPLFAVEFNLALIETTGTLRVGGSPGLGAPQTPLSALFEAGPSERVTLAEGHAGFTLDFSLSPAAAVWHYPVRTVSRSEKGYEAIYQGAALLFVWGGAGTIPSEIRISLSARLSEAAPSRPSVP